MAKNVMDTLNELTKKLHTTQAIVTSIDIKKESDVVRLFIKENPELVGSSTDYFNLINHLEDLNQLLVDSLVNIDALEIEFTDYLETDEE